MAEQTVTSGTTVRGGEGWLVFGGVVVILAGLFTIIMGIVALVADQHYVVGAEGTLVVDLTGWGWIHLVVGAAVVGTGIALALGASWARVVAVLLVGFNALSHLAFLNVSPVRSTIVIALDVLVIWAVVAHGRE